MATAPGVNDAPSESTMTQASDPPPTEGQTHAMEVDDEGTHSRPASPVSTVEDDLLMGGGVIGVESDLRLLLLKLLLLPLIHLLPWRQAERVMASHGLSVWRPAWMRNFNRIGPQSVTGPNPRGASKDQCFPSPSKTVRGGSPLLHSSMSMRESNLPSTTMWQAEVSCISIRMCCRERPCALEIRSPA